MRRRTRRSLIAFAVVLLPVVFLTPSSVALVDKGRGGPVRVPKAALAAPSRILGAAMRRRSADPPETPPADEVITGTSYRNDTSPPLRDMEPVPYGFVGDREANENPKVPLVHKDSPDEVVQNQPVVAPNIPGTTLNFDGIPFPGRGVQLRAARHRRRSGPDAVRPDRQRRLSRSSTRRRARPCSGPVGISTIWSGFGGVCETNGHGDPIVLYDQLANRWVISQFAGIVGPDRRVHRRLDHQRRHRRPTTATAFIWARTSSTIPKLAVWPDAYYMSMNVFNSSGTAFLGPQPFAFDRAKMLAGLPATFVSTGHHRRASRGSLSPRRPRRLDPAAGRRAGHVRGISGRAASTRSSTSTPTSPSPANSTFTLFASPAAAGFTQLCPDDASLRAPARRDRRTTWTASATG